MRAQLSGQEKKRKRRCGVKEENTMSVSVEKKPFGVTRDGKAVGVYCIKNEALAVEIMEYGAAIRSLRVHHDGAWTDAVLGYDTLREYEENDGYLGAVVGRVGREDPRGGARHVDLAAQAVRELRRLAVAHLAADVLDVGPRLLAQGPLTREPGHVHAPHGARDAKAGGELAHELLVLLRVEPAQPVVDVQHVQAFARDARRAAAVVDVELRRGRQEQQRRGVRAARHHEDDRRAQAVVALGRRPLEPLVGTCEPSADAWQRCLRPDERPATPGRGPTEVVGGKNVSSK